MKEFTDSELRSRLLTLREDGTRESILLEGYRTAGVLVPIVLGSREPRLLFTQRTDQVETHKGQVSFPGGMMDAGDRDIVQTALRETHEEIGIPSSSVEVVALLNDLPTPTGFIITPVVGVIEKLPGLSPNPEEVADIFQVPLSFFADPQNGRKELREFRGAQHEVWFYQSGGHSIWGATAMIVRSLVKKLNLL